MVNIGWYWSKITIITNNLNEINNYYVFLIFIYVYEWTAVKAIQKKTASDSVKDLE